MIVMPRTKVITIFMPSTTTGDSTIVIKRKSFEAEGEQYETPADVENESRSLCANCVHIKKAPTSFTL